MKQSRAYERLVRKLTTEVLWIYVARVLLESHPLKAYEIKKRITEKFGMRPRTMTTYTVIYRMSREGLLKPVKVDGDVVYELTEAGRRALDDAIRFLEKVVDYLRYGSERT